MILGLQSSDALLVEEKTFLGDWEVVAAQAAHERRGLRLSR